MILKYFTAKIQTMGVLASQNAVTMNNVEVVQVTDNTNRPLKRKKEEENTTRSTSQYGGNTNRSVANPLNPLRDAGLAVSGVVAAGAYHVLKVPNL